jgi:hypothetical protein
MENTNTFAIMPLPTYKFRRNAIRAARAACQAHAADPSPLNKSRMLLAWRTLDALEATANNDWSIEYHMST